MKFIIFSRIQSKLYILYCRKFLRQLNLAILKGDILQHLIFVIMENLFIIESLNFSQLSFIASLIFFAIFVKLWKTWIIGVTKISCNKVPTPLLFLKCMSPSAALLTLPGCLWVGLVILNFMIPPTRVGRLTGDSRATNGRQSGD